MGCCCGPVSESDKEIQSHMLDEASTDHHIKKLLLLGSGSSGKSTLFKQLKCIHGRGLDENDFIESGHYIKQNCVTGVLKLIIQSQVLCTVEEINELNRDSTFIQSVQCLLSFKHETFNSVNAVSIEDLRNIGKAMDYMWKYDVIQKVFHIRGPYFSFPDNMEYFFDKCLEIFADGWYPSLTDVIKCRIRTSGMVEIMFEIASNHFHIYDVGGQRNERKKWIHSFENVTAVIFVAALNHFDAVLFEDETQNAMLESLQLFDEICNSKWFKLTSMILFLNKSDIFENQIRMEISIRKCFNEENRKKIFSYSNLMIDQQIPNPQTQQKVTVAKTLPSNIIKVEDTEDIVNEEIGMNIKQMKVNINQNMNYANEAEYKMEEALIVKEKNGKSMDMEQIEIEDVQMRNERNLKLEQERNLGWNGTVFDGDDYHPIIDNKDEDDRYFEHCYESALNFISDQYLQMNEKNDNKNGFKHTAIFVHITNACNKDNVERVFWDTQNIIIAGNIVQAGFN